MDSKLREKLVDVFEAASLIHESHEEFGVKCEEVRRIDSTASFVGLPGPEDGWLLQVESAVQITHRCKWCLPALPNVTSIGIDPPGIAVDDIGFPGPECCCNGL
jgi:hypothetical protein